MSHKSMYSTKHMLEKNIGQYVSNVSQNKVELSYSFKKLKCINRQLNVVFSKSQNIFKKKSELQT